MIDARRRRAIRSVARQHQVRAIRWWPPARHPSWVHLLVEGRPDCIPVLRSDLERALGCRVAIYVAGQIPEEAWGSMLVETVAV
ncbi:MAG: hypothetical protein E6J41_02350 [Chloroflexi bacterium]|jgi:hypothetical protein|nr:MAG: hypothetical protein E6J41_02350 [Chloroflexota bacterium]